MNRFLKISFAGIMLAAASFAQTANSWQEQWHKAKFGRYSAAEEARQKSLQSDTAYREEATATKPPKQNAHASEGISWREQWFNTKFGRYTAAEEARQRGEQVETAYREEARTQVRPAPSAYRTNEHLEQWYKAKFGRNSPMEEAYRRGEGKQ